MIACTVFCLYPVVPCRKSVMYSGVRGGIHTYFCILLYPDVYSNVFRGYSFDPPLREPHVKT